AIPCTFSGPAGRSSSHDWRAARIIGLGIIDLRIIIDRETALMGDTAHTSGPLSGMRVLDCTHVLAGAWCSMLLADLGADVIKVEPPEGEVSRLTIGAFHAFDFVNRNKRAIAVSLDRPEGVAVLRRLAESADIWVENYRPGAL